jgi:hypothetical protein
VDNPIIKHPVLLVLTLLTVWLGMTWWLHHGDKPGEPHRHYSDDAK